MIPNEIEIFLNKRRQYERKRHKTLAKDEKQTITEYRINYYITHKKQNRDFIISWDKYIEPFFFRLVQEVKNFNNIKKLITIKKN